MRGLACLDLEGCPKVTDEGVARLQKTPAELPDRPLTPRTPPMHPLLLVLPSTRWAVVPATVGTHDLATLTEHQASP